MCVLIRQSFLVLLSVIRRFFPSHLDSSFYSVDDAVAVAIAVAADVVTCVSVWLRDIKCCIWYGISNGKQMRSQHFPIFTLALLAWINKHYAEEVTSFFLFFTFSFTFSFVLALFRAFSLFGTSQCLQTPIKGHQRR